jgi:hypothetical protein
VGCSGAGETPGCGCGAAEVTDDGEQDCGGVVTTVVEWRRSRGSEMQPKRAPGHAVGLRRGTGEPEQLLATGGATWRLRVTAARCGGAGRSQPGSSERRAVSWRSRW